MDLLTMFFASARPLGILPYSGLYNVASGVLDSYIHS